MKKNWCIKITKENIKIVGNWFDSHVKPETGYRGTYTDYCWEGDYFHYPKCEQKSCTSTSPYPGYTKITFDEFLSITKTSLPPFWAVEVTEESKEYLVGWRDCGSISVDCGYCLSEYIGAKGYWSVDVPYNYTIITLEQFKRDVLFLNQPKVSNTSDDSFDEPVIMNFHKDKKSKLIVL